MTSRCSTGLHRSTPLADIRPKSVVTIKGLAQTLSQRQPDAVTQSHTNQVVQNILDWRTFLTKVFKATNADDPTKEWCMADPIDEAVALSTVDQVSNHLELFGDSSNAVKLTIRNIYSLEEELGWKRKRVQEEYWTQIGGRCPH